jgi:hypothetical protein
VISGRILTAKSSNSLAKLIFRKKLSAQPPADFVPCNQKFFRFDGSREYPYRLPSMLAK